MRFIGGSRDNELQEYTGGARVVVPVFNDDRVIGRELYDRAPANDERGADGTVSVIAFAYSGTEWEWKFSCSTCKHTTTTYHRFDACPSCGASGWNMNHSGPVIVGPSIQLGSVPRRRHG